jgi:glycosyltransferase involved in cell wall biosynthesis
MQNTKNQTLKILHIASGDLWAGAEVQLHNLVKELNKVTGIEVHVALLNHGILEQRLLNNNIRVKIFDEKLLSAFQIFAQIRNYIKIIKPNIIHTHRQKENILGSLAAKFTGNVKSLRTVHGSSEFLYKPWQIQKQILKKVNRVCGVLFQKYIVAVSQQLGTSLLNDYPQNKVRIIENGIDVEETQLLGKIPFNLPGNLRATKIAIVGRLVSVKRVDLFLRLAESLVNDNSHSYGFYIFGDGPLYDELQDQSKELKLEKYVHWMGFQKNIPSCLTKMDLLLIMSDHEGLPMVLLEALSLGIPVISHAVGGIPYALRDGKYGTLIDNQNLIFYIDAIKKYKKSPELFKRKSQIAKTFVQQNYSAKRTAGEYYTLYQEMIR